jgi:hypothetical protein
MTGCARSGITTRHYARPMIGGDITVANRLDRARQAARAGTVEPIWHDHPEGIDREKGRSRTAGV